MAAIFISYRREDSAGTARGIYEYLIRSFDENEVFIDLESISAGEKWAKKIEKEVRSCSVFIEVIGRRWFSTRLHDQNDLVRREISMAISEGKTIIPILVDGAELPRVEDLPPRLRPMLESQAIELDQTAYRATLDTLAQRISKLTTTPITGTASILRIRRLFRWSVAGFNFYIFIDGQKIGEISNNESRMFDISPGTHVIYLEAGLAALGWLSQSKSKKVRFSIKNDETKRFICSGRPIMKHNIYLEMED